MTNVNESLLAYSEVDEILNLLEDECVAKIPKNIRNFFKKQKFDGYNPKIDLNIPLTEQNLKRETMVLLAILNINYWCDSVEEKQKLLNELLENQKELEERYNPDNLFKNRKNEDKPVIKNETTEIIEYKKPSILKSFLNKIQSFFKKK